MNEHEIEMIDLLTELTHKTYMRTLEEGVNFQEELAQGLRENFSYEQLISATVFFAERGMVDTLTELGLMTDEDTTH